MSSRHPAIRCWHEVRKPRSSWVSSSGSSAASASRLSPMTGASVGIRLPARTGSASICTTLTLPASGRCLV